jgi:catechol 2,3-dioxygenase-like lactoylglutathione lyase family enzyme
LRFYTEVLGFELVRGGADELNSSLRRGEANIMIEGAGAFYSEEYNRAIEQRIGASSPNALYIEAPDLEELHSHVAGSAALVIDPLKARDWGQSEFTVEDPDGNWLTFWKASSA